MGADEPERSSGDHGGLHGLHEEIADSGELLGGEPLQGLETATTVRVRGGKTATTDGPFAETKEVLGGYYLVDCRTWTGPSSCAARIPDAATGSIEVRPILEMAGVGLSGRHR